MKDENLELDKVRQYWNKKNIPQQWYSNKEPFSLQWFNDLAQAHWTVEQSQNGDIYRHFAQYLPT